MRKHPRNQRREGNPRIQTCLLRPSLLRSLSSTGATRDRTTVLPFSSGKRSCEGPDIVSTRTATSACSSPSSLVATVPNRASGSKIRLSTCQSTTSPQLFILGAINEFLVPQVLNNGRFGTPFSLDALVISMLADYVIDTMLPCL